MKKYCRTDLACEASEDIAHIEGTKYELKESNMCIVERLDIITDEAASKLGKKKGRYITVTMPLITYLDDENINGIVPNVSNEIKDIILKVLKAEKIGSDLSVLVVGLGNSKITADAIGPETLGRITVTRHLKNRDDRLFRLLDTCTVSAIAPGVLGTTGIESAELVKAAAQKATPDVIIIIDALAARSTERLARTVQITDTGITPGEGVGNVRCELSRQTLGIPVIAIGVPTVVDSTTMVFDALASAGISKLSDDLLVSLDSAENFFVTPKETDVIIERYAMLLGRALSNAFVISH